MAAFGTFRVVRAVCEWEQAAGIGKGAIVQTSVRAIARLMRGILLAGSLAFAMPLHAQDDGASVDAIFAAYNSGDFEEAARLSEQRIAALRRQPDQQQELASALVSHGAILIALERLDDAKLSLDEAVRIGDRLGGAALGSAMLGRYNLGMGFVNAERPGEAVAYLEEALARKLASLNRDPKVALPDYDRQAVQWLIDLGYALYDAGRTDAALARIVKDLPAIGFSVFDMPTRAEYLEALYDLYSIEGRAAALDSDDLASFVASTRFGDSYSDEDYHRQQSVLRRVYEAAGKTEQAHRLAITDPIWVEEEFAYLMTTDTTAALALIDESIAAFRRLSDSQGAGASPAADVLVALLRSKASRLSRAGLAEEEIAARRDLLAVLERRQGRFSDDAQSERAALADLLRQAGRTREAGALAIYGNFARPGGAGEGSRMIALAEALREGGYAAEAEQVLDERLSCRSETDPDTGASDFGCTNTIAAMREYAALLEARGKAADARFYALPSEIVAANASRSAGEAREKADQLVEIGVRQFAADSPRLPFALRLHRQIWKSGPLRFAEVPEEYARCNLSAEAEPPPPRQVVIGQDDGFDLPRIAVAAPPPPPPSPLYFSEQISVSALDPKGLFYNGLREVYPDYAEQCAALGNVQGGLAFTEWAIGEARRLGYAIQDQEELLLAKAALEENAGDYGAAENTYRAMADVYLSKLEQARTETRVINPFSSSIETSSNMWFDRMIGFYARIGRLEKIYYLTARMSEAGLFEEGILDSGLPEPILRVLFEYHLGRGETDKAAQYLFTLSPPNYLHHATEIYWDATPGLDSAALAELGPETEVSNPVSERLAETLFAMNLARLSIAAGEPRYAKAMLDDAELRNNRFVEERAAGRDSSGNVFVPDPNGVSELLGNIDELLATLDRDGEAAFVATLGGWEQVGKARRDLAEAANELAWRGGDDQAQALIDRANRFPVEDRGPGNRCYVAGQPIADLRLSDPALSLNQTINLYRARLLLDKGDETAALAAFQSSGLLSLVDDLLARKAEEGDEAFARRFGGREKSEALFGGYRAGLASMAELAMRLGQPQEAAAYLDRVNCFPRGRGWNVAEQQVMWVGVSLGVQDPAQRISALDDAAVLASGLEQQWRLASRNRLDTVFLNEALKGAPYYFGDIAALEWRARDSGKVDESEAFRHVQWSILSSTDLSIAQSTGAAVLARSKPKALDLLAERDLLAGALSQNAEIDASGGSSFGAGRDLLETSDTVNNTALRLDAIDAELQRIAPEYFEITSSEPVNLQETQALLRKDEAILLLSPGRFGTQIMLVRKDALTWRQSDLTQDEVTLAVRRLRFSAGGEVDAVLSETEQWIEEVDGGLNGFDRDTAHGLYSELIAPVAQALGGARTLYIAGGGSLTSLPFAMLVREIAPGADDDPAALRATKWFGDDYSLVQIPSISSFALLRRQARGERQKGTSFIGFGDPVLEGPPMRRGARRSAGDVRALAAVWEKQGNASVVDVAAVRRLSQLPGTAVELRDLASALNAPASALNVQSAATETRVRQTDLLPFRVIAFATHGLTAGELPGGAEPGLIFTPPSSGSAADDGYLSASEVAQLDLDADWIILSACNTASADGSTGAPALSGLARSFFQAGARGLLVSHWPIRDDVAARLTALAVEYWQQDPGLSRADALRKAMAQIRNDAGADGFVNDARGNPVQQSWAHPNAWAPFTLVGDAY